MTHIRRKGVKGVVSQSRVDALPELCSPLVKGGNFIFFQKPNIRHSNNNNPNGPNRNKMGSNY